MSKSLNLDSFDPNQEDLNVSGNIPDGLYHARIRNYSSETKPKGECHIIIWEIIGTENDSRKLPAIGRFLNDYLNDFVTCKEIFARQVFALIIATGFVTRETLVSAKEQGLEIPSPDFSQLVGKSCVIKVVNEEFAGKTYSRISGFYPVDGKEALKHGVMINDTDTSSNIIDDMVF